MEIVIAIALVIIAVIVIAKATKQTRATQTTKTNKKPHPTVHDQDPQLAAKYAEVLGAVQKGMTVERAQREIEEAAKYAEEHWGVTNAKSNIARALKEIQDEAKRLDETGAIERIRQVMDATLERQRMATGHESEMKPKPPPTIESIRNEITDIMERHKNMSDKEADQIIRDYGTAIVETSAKKEFIADESRLPGSKDRIKAAIMSAMFTTKDQKYRDALISAYVGLSEFQKGVVELEPTKTKEEHDAQVMALLGYWSKVTSEESQQLWNEVQMIQMTSKRPD